MLRQSIIGALLVVSVAVVLGATVFRSDLAQATGLGQSVTVNNTPAQAVPVREQALDGGNIKVHEEGRANVNDVADPADLVTQRLTAFCTGTTGDSDPYTVPAGKVLVIENVAYRTSGDRRLITLITQPPGGGTFNYYPLPQAPDLKGSEQFWVGNENIRAYVSSGWTVQTHLNCAASDPDGVVLTLTGHLIPA